MTAGEGWINAPVMTLFALCRNIIILYSNYRTELDCLLLKQVCIITRGQPHPKYKANSARTSHIAIWERDPLSLGVTGYELQNGAERGPVDRDGARSTKSKHSTSSIRGLRVSPGRCVGL